MEHHQLQSLFLFSGEFKTVQAPQDVSSQRIPVISRLARSKFLPLIETSLPLFITYVELIRTNEF